jgi:hypothetical protein
MIASAGVRHKAESAKRFASRNRALRVLLGTRLAATVTAAWWKMRASPSATPAAEPSRGASRNRDSRVRGSGTG